MPKLLSPFLTLLALLAGAGVSSAAGAAVWEAPPCAVQVSPGVTGALDAALLADALAIPAGALRGVTILTLPDCAAGRLICEGVAVEAYDYLPADALGSFVFESFSEETAARFTLLPDADGLNAERSLLLASNSALAREVLLSDAVLAWRRAENGYFSGVRGAS